MKANALRTILLVKSIEEHDADGAMLTLAEREAATREALRTHPASATGDRAEGHAWRVLEARARELYARLVERHPVVTRAVTLETRASRATLAVLLVGFLLGLGLSVVDSRVRIEIVAFPLLGLVLWNLAVYAVSAYAALRRRPASGGSSAGDAYGWVLWPARWGWRRAAALIRQAAFYHKPLAAGLRRFSDEWWPLAQPLLVLQGRRIFHLAAAAVALGLVAGFYVRGIALEYRAGWESTFLGPGEVRGLLHTIYAPAASLSGNALPASLAEVEALHWRDGAGGGPAATWIHLMAVTAMLFVVLPRLLLAGIATLALARASRSVPVPDSLLPYAHSILGGSDAALPPVTVRVTPFAYEPGPAATDGLRRLLAETFGPATRVELQPVVPYGEEARLEQSMQAPADVQLVLLNLASTPEVENHGAALTHARNAGIRGDTTTRRVAVVDESSFAARMGGDPSLASRVDDRRRAWGEFVARHGWDLVTVNLESALQSPAVPAEAIDGLRRAGRGRRL
jgi:hypothetical protein